MSKINNKSKRIETFKKTTIIGKKKAILIEELQEKLLTSNYIASDDLSLLIFIALKLNKPILVEGPAGTGKTELAKVMSTILERPLVRLQCYEGIDEAQCLYEWDYAKQILFIQLYKDRKGKDFDSNNKDLQDELFELEEDILFSERFLIKRPILQAFQTEKPVVFLIDELDRTDREVEALFLETFSEYQITIPEIGTIKAKSIPLVIITSNETREVSEALRRRCLYFRTDYPSFDEELEIIKRKIPKLDVLLASKGVEIIQNIRKLDLNKKPSVAETLDWAKALLLMNISLIDEDTFMKTMNILLKNNEDINTTKNNIKNLLDEVKPDT